MKLLSILPLLFLCLTISTSAQSHPRLLFGSEDIPDLRARLNTEPYQSIYQQLMDSKDLATDLQYGPSWPAVRYAFLYVLTGDTTYANVARDRVEEIINLSDWARDGYKALGRSMLGKGVAFAYDFCYDAWPQDFRNTVSLALKTNAKSLMSSGGSGWPGDNAVANNWHGVRYAGALLCFLASDETGNNSDISTAYSKLKSHFESKYGTGSDSQGWDLEGIGYIQYPWGSFLGATGIALKRLEGIDIVADTPALAYAIWSLYPGAVALPTFNHSINAQNLGLHPDFSDSNPNMFGEGSHALAFYYAPEEYRPGVKWVYDNFWGADGIQNWDHYRHGEVYSYLLYPTDSEVVSENPETVWGLNYVDERFGLVSFRNRYQDEGDLVTQMHGRHIDRNKTHAGSDINSLRIFGLGTAWTTGSGRTSRSGGQTTLFPSDPGSDRGNGDITGSLLVHGFREDGSGYMTAHGSATGVVNHTRQLITDYSGDSGAPGVWVIRDISENGMLWRLNTPEMNTISTHAGGFTITAPNGNTMVGTILHPANVTPTTGVFDRGSSFNFETTSYENNNFVDVPGTDGSFLIVLTVNESGQSAPTVTNISGQGVDQSFLVGNTTFSLLDGGLAVSSWAGGEVPPIASITSHASGSYFKAGKDLNLQVKATSTAGTVSAVRFYEGETLLGTDTSAPFEWTVPAVSAGEKQWLVIAVDDKGVESLPTALKLSVVEPRNSFGVIEAEDYDSNNGFRQVSQTEIGYLNKRGWTGYEAIDFGTIGPVSVSVSGKVVSGGSCDFRIGSTSGPVIASVSFSGSSPFTAQIEPGMSITGIQDLYFTWGSGGPGVANVDNFTFVQGDPPATISTDLHRDANESNTLNLVFMTHAGYNYHLENKSDLNASTWNPFKTVVGTDDMANEPVDMNEQETMFYRIRRELAK